MFQPKNRPNVCRLHAIRGPPDYIVLVSGFVYFHTNFSARLHGASQTITSEGPLIKIKITEIG